MLRHRSYCASSAAALVSFNPAVLFAAGEQGVWFDPGDLSTMFSDTAGTTPATVGSGVARINDKSGRGNHATQSTSGSRPILARHPASGRRNLWTYTRQLSNAAWNKSGVTITDDAATAYDGSATLDKLVAGSTGLNAIYRLSGIGNGVAAVISFDAKAGSKSVIQIGINAALGGTIDRRANFNLANGTLGSVDAGTTATITPVPGVSGLYRCSATFTGVSTSATANVVISMQDSTSAAREANSTAGDIYLGDIQIEAGSIPSDRQIVASTYDVTEPGVQSIYHLVFDGSDDFLVTGSIDFTGGDKISAWAAFRKLSNSFGIVAELSASAQGANPGSFAISAGGNGLGGSPTGSLGDQLQGSSILGTDTGTGFPAPATLVTSHAFNIGAATGATEAVINVNGVAQTMNATGGAGTAGTGNFGNYPIYIGSRGGSSQRFSGNLYGVIIRAGVSSADQIGAAERWMNLYRTLAY